MSEIITINIGGYGTCVGDKFYQKLLQQYQQQETDSNSELRKNIFMKHRQTDNSYQPRGIFIDTDPKIHFLSKQAKKINYRAQQIIVGEQSCKNLYPEGIYLAGGEIINQFEESIRRQAEQCDCLSGFIVISHLGGGAGSGLGALCLSKLREGGFASPVIEGYTSIPSRFQQEPMNHLQIYNTILSLHQHIENSDLEIIHENSAIQRLIFKKGILHPTIDDMNDNIAHGLIQNTAPYRYRGQLNTNQRKKATNIILFPRMKFLLPGLSEKYSSNYIKSCFLPGNRLINQRNLAKIFSTYVSVRDPFASDGQINSLIHEELPKYGNLQQWIPSPFGLSLTHKIQKNYGASAWSLLNCQNSIESFKQIGNFFTNQFRRKAFLHHYTSRGMDEMQFTEAESNCNDLISQYTPYTNDYYEEEEDYGSES